VGETGSSNPNKQSQYPSPGSPLLKNEEVLLYAEVPDLTIGSTVVHTISDDESIDQALVKGKQHADMQRMQSNIKRVIEQQQQASL
jgi:hypothetical protein